VISDLSMPSMTGWQFAQAIKEASQARGVSRPAFIILTGWGSNLPEEEKLGELGVDRVMRKPIKVQRLMSLVYELVRGRRSAQGAPGVSGEIGRNPA